MFRSHAVGFKPAVGRGPVVFANTPLQELLDCGPVVVASWGWLLRHRSKEGVQVPFGQFADGMAGKRLRMAEPHTPVYGCIWLTIAPAGPCGLGAWLVGFDEFLDGFRQVFALHGDDGGHR